MKTLFIDDGDVQGIDDLARVLHPPAKFRGNAVLRPEHRWENCAIQVRTTPAWDPEGERFHWIYLASAEGPDVDGALRNGYLPEGGEAFFCYATSEDGVNWEKPFLGLHDYAGLTWRGTPHGTENNIVPTAKGMLQGPIYHAHEADPARRFKGMHNLDGKLQAAVSADCVHWEPLPGVEVPSSDEANLGYDEVERLFLATPKRRGPYGRSFHLITSRDFETWEDHGLVFHADAQDQVNGAERLQRFFDDPDLLTPVHNRPEEWRTDVYNFPVFRYEGLYLGLPVMHHWSGKHPPLYENVDSRKSVELTASRDLRTWERVAGRAPFLELSPVGDGSAYDTGQMVVTNGPVRRNGELWFYYTGLRHRSRTIHDLANRAYLDASAACMARLRLDGFVGLRAGVEWGQVTTVPLAVDGGQLRINADAWRGRVRAEVLEADAERAVPGFGRDDCVAVMEDGTDITVRWRDGTDLTALRGRSVRLRFHLWQAEIFACWFAA